MEITFAQLLHPAYEKAAGDGDAMMRVAEKAYKDYAKLCGGHIFKALEDKGYRYTSTRKKDDTLLVETYKNLKGHKVFIEFDTDCPEFSLWEGPDEELVGYGESENPEDIIDIINEVF